MTQALPCRSVSYVDLTDCTALADNECSERSTNFLGIPRICSDRSMNFLGIPRIFSDNLTDLL